MDAIEALHGRRSIRTYDDAPVDESLVTTLLEAAMAAPSAGNQQSWRFVVVTERGRLDQLASATPYAQPLSRAPLGIVICADTRDNKHPGYWVQDCSAATQNLLLAAHASGLGAVWIGVHPIEERSAAVKRILNVPDGVVPLSMIAIGHPAEEKPPAERFNGEFVYREHWG